MKRTVLYTHGGGRMGNQIVRFAHWMAWASAHQPDVEVINLGFWPFAHLFEHWREHPGCIFPPRPGLADGFARCRARLPRWIRAQMEANHRLQRLVYTVVSQTPGWQSVALDDELGEGLDLEPAAFIRWVAQSGVTACSGWKIASWALLAAQESELREYFRPAPEHLGKAKLFNGELRRRHDFLIGVLVRQSDYKVWDDGRFYFPTSKYAEWIRQAVRLYAGRNVGVIVASEAWQDPGEFHGLPVYLASGNPGEGGHWFENWVELSLCDIVMSAPSTFSATAAFRGGVPLWPVGEKDQVLDFTQIVTDGLAGAAHHPLFSRSVK